MNVMSKLSTLLKTIVVDKYQLTLTIVLTVMTLFLGFFVVREHLHGVPLTKLLVQKGMLVCGCYLIKEHVTVAFKVKHPE